MKQQRLTLSGVSDLPARRDGSSSGAPTRSPALLLPLLPQARHQSCEAQALRPFERSLPNAMVGVRSLRVAVRAQRDARIIRGLHGHTAIRSRVCRLGTPFDAARAAGQGSNPTVVPFITCGTHAR